MAALAFPLDLIESGVFWRRSFRLSYRQEVSRVAGGTTIRKNNGRPLWKAEFASRRLSANEVSYVRARLDSLDGGLFTFMGYDPARCRPIAYPGKGGWFEGFNGIGNLAAIYEDRKRIDVGGFPSGYIFSVGDLINVGAARLYSVVKGATAGSDGVAYEIEVRPYLYPETSVGNAVSVLRPFCDMAINPDETSEDVDPTTGRGNYSFTAWEVTRAASNI